MARLAALLLVPLLQVFAFRARNLQAIATAGQEANDKQRTPGVAKVVVLLDAAKHMAPLAHSTSKMVTDVVEGLSVAGKSQTAIGYFNAKASGLLSGFTSNASALVASVSSITYESSAQVMPALKECKKSLPEQDSGSVNTRVCLLIMDNEFMCGGRVEPEATEMCKMFPDLCPDDVDSVGNNMEYEDETLPCTNFVKDEAGGITFAMAMSAKSEADKQMRLSNLAFRDFVTTTTGCGFVHENKADGKSTIATDPDTCQRFSFTTDFGQLRTWASQLLPREADTPGTPQDPAQDPTQDPVQGNPAQDPAQDTSTKNGLHLCSLSLVIASVISWISI